MPHSSHPVDDICTRPYDREHGPWNLFHGFRGSLVSCLLALDSVGLEVNQRVERSSDGCPLCYVIVVSDSSILYHVVDNENDFIML